MKKIILLLCIVINLGIVTANAQSLAINNTGATANSTSILDVSSTSKGLLIPRLSSVQRTSISTPANGLLVYDNDSLAFAYYNGVEWSFIKGNNNIASAWSTKGNTGTTAANFIGTIDNQDVIFKRWNVKAGLLSFTNTAFGYHTLVANTTGSFNSAFGVEALISNTTGNYNVAVGLDALYSNTSGFNNTANGSGALVFNTTGSHNTATGAGALYFNSTGSHNTANGDSALYNNTIGDNNVAIGSSALYNNTDRSNLVAIGDSALYNNGTGALGILQATQNTAIGSKALHGNTTGYSNVAIGSRAGFTNVNGSNNTAIGALALENNTSSSNTAVGNAALRKLTGGSGYGNTAIGDSAAVNLTGTGNLNTIIGYLAFKNHTSGIFNTAIGTGAMFSDGGGGQYNTAIGGLSLPEGGGFYNIALGHSSGNRDTAGFDNTYLGHNTASLTGYLSNATAIGSYAMVSANNSIVLGSINGINGALVDTKVGIGVTNPTEKLEIGNGRLRFRGNVTGGNAHGITWTNNAGTTDRAFVGMETDDLFGIFNFGLSNWNVRVHNTSGEMGIFKQPLTTNSDSRLQIKQRGIQNGIGIEVASNTNHWDMYLDNTTTPDFNFYFNGTLKSYIRNSDGAYIQVSDKNLKKDITPLQSSLQKINTLVPYQYHYLDNSNSDNYSIGFMAQDVQKLYPDAVSEKVLKDGKTQLGVNYQYFTVLAIKGLQEQQESIVDLQNQIKELKKLVENFIKK